MNLHDLANLPLSHIWPPYGEPIPSDYISPRGIGLTCREDAFNSAVAALGCSDNAELRSAIVQMVAPQLPVHQWPDGQVPRVVATGNDADWRIEDADGNVLAITEHKPAGAPAHWSRGPVEYLMDPAGVTCDDGYIEELEACAHVLNKKKFTPEEDAEITPLIRYFGRMGIPKRDPSAYYHRMPQVIVYRARHGLPCQILTDSASTATALYIGSDNNRQWCPYELVDSEYPIHTTAEALNSLAHALEDVDLTRKENAAVTRIADAMWMRAPWKIGGIPIEELMSTAAMSLVSLPALWTSMHIADIDWTPWPARGGRNRSAA